MHGLMHSLGADMADGNWSIYSAKPNQGGHGFGCWISLESQVVQISGYRDIRVGTSLATKRSAVEMVLIGQRQ
jgi:hypothetical protein